MFSRLSLSKSTTASIAWEMTPDLAFCTFSAKGLSDGLVNTDERICYFFIDNYGTEPRLYLMERGTRYVNILAEINAPKSLLTDCIIGQGRTSSSKDNFAIDSIIKEWLIANVINTPNNQYLIPVIQEDDTAENFGKKLPLSAESDCDGEILFLPTAASSLRDKDVESTIRQWNFYDALQNPDGSFSNILCDTGNDLTIKDKRTGIVWQRYGLDLCSIRKMLKNIEQLNKKGMAGFHDWRMPSLEEAMSLMTPAVNSKGLHLHPCFSKNSPFIFTSAKRKPTGYWFADYKQGKVYWSSGTVPGGFCRLCRKNDETSSQQGQSNERI